MLFSCVSRPLSHAPPSVRPQVMPTTPQHHVVTAALVLGRESLLHREGFVTMGEGVVTLRVEHACFKPRSGFQQSLLQAEFQRFQQQCGIAPQVELLSRYASLDDGM